jgi:aldehyde dehydrogenase (NAD+)
VIRVADADEAVPREQRCRVRLSSSLYTRDVSLAFRAFNELDNGITYINAPTIGAEAHLPFGGVKQTGNGHREGAGRSTSSTRRPRSGTATFSGALQRAQIDNYLGTPTEALSRW